MPFDSNRLRGFGMRLFLGLPWPEEALEDLAARAQVWEGRSQLRLVKPENWHVTLRFLGDVGAEKVSVLVDLLEAWGRSKGAMTFVDRGWSCFGSYQVPRVVLLQLEALPAVQRAVSALHKDLDTAGFPGEDKAWKPHVTLAYGKGGDPGPWPEEPLGGRPPVVFQRAVLFESELGPEGSRYRELASLAFGKEKKS